MAGRIAHLNMQTHEDSEEQDRPSIFDILAHESLMAGLKPAAKFMLKFGSSFHPNLVRHLTGYLDEYFAGFELLLHNYYLKHCSASFSENFYGLKRVSRLTRQNVSLPRFRYRSLLFLVVVPYIKAKLDSLLDKIKDDKSIIRKSFGWKKSLYKAFISIYPKLCACLEFWTLILQVGYLIHKSDTHSPWIYLAGVLLRNSSGDVFPSAGTQDFANERFANDGLRLTIVKVLSSIWSRFFGGLCKMLGVGLLFVQFLDWWQNNERDKKIIVSLPVPKPPHSLFIDEKSVLKMAPHHCPICRSKRRNDTVLTITGFVFCYSCIFQHVKKHKSCPVTNLPASTEHLVRLFFPQQQSTELTT